MDGSQSRCSLTAALLLSHGGGGGEWLRHWTPLGGVGRSIGGEDGVGVGLGLGDGGGRGEWLPLVMELDIINEIR